MFRSLSLLVAVTTLFCGLPAFANNAAVRALERGASSRAKSRVAKRTLNAYQSPHFAVAVRPDRGVITVTQRFQHQGFFLDKHGRLAPKDAQRLAKLLAPVSLSVAAVEHGLAASTKEAERNQHQLDAQNPTISRLVAHTATLRAEALSRGKGAEDIVIRQSPQGSLVYRPSVNVLVGSSGLSSTAFFLRERDGRPILDEGSREGLQRFLLAQP